jgi:hypothetical protein
MTALVKGLPQNAHVSTSPLSLIDTLLNLAYEIHVLNLYNIAFKHFPSHTKHPKAEIGAVLGLCRLSLSRVRAETLEDTALNHTLWFGSAHYLTTHLKSCRGLLATLLSHRTQTEKGLRIILIFRFIIIAFLRITVAMS